MSIPKTWPEPKNEALRWQKVHSGDPKRFKYRQALKEAAGCQRVSDMATTPGGLTLSGKCVWLGRQKEIMGATYFQVWAP